MNRTYTRNHLVLVAIITSLVSGFLVTVHKPIFDTSPVFAQGTSGAARGLVLYAAPRRDTMKDESFIFYDEETGDLWVYRNEDLKEHYRVTRMGEKLEKIKN